jgi:non-homologous end joining protein Ku
LALAAKIINSQSGKFEPKKIPDQYAAAIREMILEPPSPANRKKIDKAVCEFHSVCLGQ